MKVVEHIYFIFWSLLNLSPLPLPNKLLKALLIKALQLKELRVLVFAVSWKLKKDKKLSNTQAVEVGMDSA